MTTKLKKKFHNLVAMHIDKSFQFSSAEKGNVTFAQDKVQELHTQSRSASVHEHNEELNPNIQKATSVNMQREQTWLQGIYF